MVEVVCMGEILVDVIPVDASVYRDGMAFEIHFGDAPANVAVGVARLGRTMTKRVKLRFAPNLEIEFTNREKVVRQMHELAEKGQESLELSMNPKAVENSIATLIH